MLKKRQSTEKKGSGKKKMVAEKSETLEERTGNGCREYENGCR